MNVTECFLVRHAKSQPHPDTPEELWPLSPDGRVQAEQLCRQMAPLGVTKIYSSPYPRAVDTVAPLAKSLKIGITTRIDLRERKLSEKLIDNWLIELQKTWRNFDYCLPGGESNRACQNRVRACFAEILSESQGMKIAVSSHGNAIALLMNSIQPAFRFESWKAMANPHVFKLSWDGSSIHWDEGFLIA
jgi:2,3-bisphosphoglycerate-dependent phosphoglycerate mutase